MSTFCVIPKEINIDLQKERRAATFDVEELAVWWHNGVKKLKFKRELEQAVFKNLNDGHLHHSLSWEDTYTLAVKNATEAATKIKNFQQIKNPGGNDIWPKEYYGITCYGLMPTNYPLATHITMFCDVIKSQGTAEQVEKFGKLADACKIIGTYAQTELAHGTNVRGIQTRADFDRTTDEFVLNTPSLQAYKWWPGGLGHTANHAMVVAQLYIDDVHKGIQMFIVPIRDQETHMPLPGVDVGEIGKKVGMAGVNQGFLGLKNVRIPRSNMLMKNAKVMPDGSFIESPAAKLNYMTMVYTRCLIVDQNTLYLGFATTIATRYSAVRRQSPINSNDAEPQIIDHVTQQLKLFPEIATVFALKLAAKRMWQLYEQTMQDIEQGQFTRLPELHVLSCAMKVLCTTDSCAGIERLRLSCGGHGYLAAANFGDMYGNAVAAYTYEGENTVLLLQVGRFLVKSWNALVNAEKLSPSVLYFEVANRLQQFPAWNNSWQCIVNALQYTAANKTRIAFENLAQRMAEGQTQGEAANNTGIELTQAAELHGRQFLAATFLEQVTGSQASQHSPALQILLEQLLELYLVHTALRHMNDILRFVNLSDADLRSLQQRLELSLQKIRPNAVTICDGFDFHDRNLNSVLGCYDGNVYERIFESAKKSPLNQKPVPKAFEQYLKPFMKSNL